MNQILSLAHVDLLSRVDLFARLDRVTLAQLAAYLEPVTVAARSAVCRQGDPPDGLYIVTRGTFGVYTASPDGQGEARVGSLAAGDAFGEMGLLADEPRSATVRAEGDGEVLWLERARFLGLLDRQPTTARQIAATLSRRLQATNRTLQEAEQTVAREIEQALARLSPERRARVLQASLLDQVSLEALGALFGPDAGEVAEDLAAAGVTVGQTTSVAQHALRARFEREVGVEPMRQMAEQTASRLAEARLWEDALALLASHAPPAALARTLVDALRATPSLPRERARRWIERLADEEAVQEPELALARAALHEERGDFGAAASVVQRALAAAAAAGDTAGGQRLSEETARLAAVGGAAGARAPRHLGHGLQAIGAQVQRRGRRGAVEIGAVLGLVGSAVLAGNGRPREVFLLLLAAAIVLWMAELIPRFVVGLGLVVGWVLFGIAAPTQAAAGFASMEWIFVVAVLGIAAAIARSGLLFRMGLLLVRRLPHGLVPQSAALLLTGVILSPLLPHSHGRAALTAPLALAVAQALRLRDREPAAAVLGLAAWIGAGPLLFLFLNGSSLSLLVWGLLPEATRARFDWFTWLGAAAPLGVVTAVGGLATLFVVLRPTQAASTSRQRVNVQLAVLGPLSMQERAMIVVLLLTMLGSIFAPLLRIHLGTVAVLGLLAAAITGNFDRRAFQELDWDFLIFSGVALSVSYLVHALQLDYAAAKVITTELGAISARFGEAAVSPLVFVLGIAVANLLLRLVLEQLEVTFLLVLALVPVAPTLGVDPWVVVVTILATSAMWFHPDETHAYVVAQEASEERLFSDQQARKVAFGYALVTIVGLALSVPYWRLLGLL